MRKTNWKISLFVWAPSFLVMYLLFGFDGAIGAGINALLAYIPVYAITKLFNIDMNFYYDHSGKKITKEEYEKLDNKVDYGFHWLPKWTSKKKS